MIKFFKRQRYIDAMILVAVIGISIVWSVSPVMSASLNSEEINDLYSQAKAMFRDANALVATDPEKSRLLYEKAVMRFERIVKEGDIHNGKLYYNIGNIYFRIKDIGRAILNYRRAQQLIPQDRNLLQNLDFARSHRIDRIEEKQETRILKTLFFWHYDLSTRTRVFIFSFSFMLLWIFAAIRMFIRKPFLGWCIALSIGFSLLFSSSLLTEFVNLRQSRPGVVISSEVMARKGNSDTYEPSFKDPLHTGTEFTLVEKRGDWYHIELTDSRKCWVSVGDVELVR